MYKILYIIHRAICEYLAWGDADAQDFARTVKALGGRIVGIIPTFN